MKRTRRCTWPKDDPLMISYHDLEWGTPLHDDRKLFEFMILDAFQAGLSWQIVLKKRKGFEKAFHNFDAKKIAKYGAKDVKRLMNTANIIRNRLKIVSTIENANRFLEIQKEFHTFDRYIWQFTGGKTIINRHRLHTNIPTTSKESDAMSKDLKKRGFKFVGSVICYSFMQAAGMVNDHMTSCFRHKEVRTGRELYTS